LRNRRERWEEEHSFVPSPLEKNFKKLPRKKTKKTSKKTLKKLQELCAGGSVLEAARRGSLSEARVSDIARSILRFLAQCHAKGIVFRDVKVREK
jgi:serine/threonine protein kinase